MCAANVHWHLGAEHYNKGTYDVPGEEWLQRQPEETRRRLAGANTVPGFFCQGYDRRPQVVRGRVEIKLRPTR